MARSHAVAKRCSLSKAIADLMTMRSENPLPPRVKDEASQYFDPELGILVSRANRVVTADDVRRAEDDENLRILEAGGFLGARLPAVQQPPVQQKRSDPASAVADVASPHLRPRF